MDLWRFAWRRLIRRPGATAMQVVVLALGIGLAAAALSPLWRAVITKPPIANPDRVVSIWETSAARGWTSAPASPANLNDWATRSRTLAAVAYHASARDQSLDGQETLIEGPAGSELSAVLAVSPNLFDVLGVTPARGRGFAASDGETGGALVAVLGEEIARRQFGRAELALGRTIEIDGNLHTVIGVMPRGFWFPATRVALWTPLRVPPGDFTTRRQARVFRVVSRLRPGATVEQAREDLARVAADLSREYPRTNGNTGIGVSTLEDWLVGPRRAPYGLAAACGLLLLVTALFNAGFVASSSLGARVRDIAIARALGAESWRLHIEVAAGAVIVAAASTLAGWPIGAAALTLASGAFGDGAVPAGGLDVRALGVAAGVTAAGLILVLVVASARLRAVTAHPIAADLDTSRHTRRVNRWASTLQVGAAVALAVGAAAAIRTYTRLTLIPTGINQSEGLTATVTLRGPRFRDEAQVARYFKEALERVRTLPGVTRAGATALLPFRGAGWTAPIWMDGINGIDAVAGPDVRHREITDGYVSASGLPLIAGREFTPADALGPRPVLVNAAFVERLTHGQSPLGRELLRAAPPQPSAPSIIVGVVGDERLDPRDSADVPMVYEIHAAVPEETMTIVIRASGAAGSLSGSVRSVLTQIDPAAIVLRLEPLDRAIGEGVKRERAVAALSALTAAVALLLACVGLFVMATLEARQRRRELAIRLALGASPNQMSALVGSRWFGPLVVGALCGGGLVWAALSVWATRLEFLTPTLIDAVAAVAAVGVSLSAAVAPALVMARRTNPVRWLRQL